jgi:uncharacterized membrane protein YuzA (DUF378 family)
MATLSTIIVGVLAIIGAITVGLIGALVLAVAAGDLTRTITTDLEKKDKDT